jgi:hypothetical protein
MVASSNRQIAKSPNHQIGNSPNRQIALWLTFLVALPAAAAAQSWDVAETDRAGQWTIYGGIANGAALGLPLAAGDFNGDGYDDVIITPMNANIPGPNARNRAGAAFIVLSSGTIAGETDLATLLPPVVSPQVAVVYGADDRDYFGTEVWAADLDRDGYDDAIIGAQRAAGPGNLRPGAGEVVILWGNPGIGGSLIDLAEAGSADLVTIVYGARSGDRLGVWVSAGDFDGDGFPDALMGADQSNGAEGTRMHVGATYVLYGGRELRQQRTVDLAATDVPFTVVYGIDDEDHSGSTVRGYDLDGDGADDLLIGAGINRLSATVAGHAVAGGDGPNNDVPIAGEAYVVYGTVGQRPAVIDLRSPPASTVFMYGIDEGDAYGEELFAGDFNGDGHGDIAIGALSADGPNNARRDAGELALILGSPSLRGSRILLSDPPAGVTIFYGAEPSAIAGDTAMLVDINGDGRDELVIGSPQGRVNGRPRAGVVDVFFGTDQPLPRFIDLGQPPASARPFRILGAEVSDMLAYSMAFGDIDNDGIYDLVINVMAGDGFENMVQTAGDAYVLAGPRVSEAAGQPVTFPTPTATATVTPTPGGPTLTPTRTPCFGDCDGDGAVRSDDLLRAVSIALEVQPIELCRAADANQDERITVNELVAVVGVVVEGCGAAAGEE